MAQMIVRMVKLCENHDDAFFIGMVPLYFQDDVPRPFLQLCQRLTVGHYNVGRVVPPRLVEALATRYAFRPL